MVTQRSGGLGRGLGELFQRTEPSQESPSTQAGPQASAPLPDGSYFQEIPVAAISPNPKQPRQVFDEDELSELAESIKEVGLLQPIVVRKQGSGYELIMGERRWRAHQQAAITTIPAIVRATDDTDLLRDALLENLHRTQLNPLEEAAAYQQLLEDFNCSQDELAKRIKRSRPHISNTIRLLRLPSSVQRRIAAGVLTSGHARALLSLDDPLAMEQLAQRIVAEGMTVRDAEEAVTLARRHDLAPTVGARKARVASPLAESAAGRLSDCLDTRVKVTMGAKRGRVVIEFAGEQDLERIMALIEHH